MPRVIVMLNVAQNNMIKRDFVTVLDTLVCVFFFGVTL